MDFSLETWRWFQDDLRQLFALVRVLLQHRFRRGTLSRLRLSQGCQSLLVVQDLLKLLRRPEVEGSPRLFIGLFGKRLHAHSKLPALLRQQAGIDERSGLLDAGQHRQQRQLDVLVDAAQLSCRLQPRPQRLVEPERDIGFLRGVVRGGLDCERREVELLGALAGDVLVARRIEPEVLRRERLEAVPARADAVEDIRLEHRVARDAGQRDVVPREHVAGRFEVVADLGDRGVLKEGPEGLQHGRQRQLPGAGEVVSHRQVGRHARLDRDRETRDPRVHVVAPVGVHRQRESPRLPQPPRPGVEFRQFSHADVVALGRRRFVRFDAEFREPGPELEPGKELGQRRPRQAGLGTRSSRATGSSTSHRIVARSRDSGSWSSAPRRFSPTLPVTSSAPAITPSRIAEPLDPLRRRLRANLGDSRDVVDAVPHEREVVDDPLRRHAVLGRHALPVEGRLAHRVDQRHVVADELRHVLVRGRDDRRPATGGGLCREGADHVVRLDVRHDQQRHAHRLDDLVDRLDLLPEVGRHRRTVGLVLRVDVVPEGLARRVEHDCHRAALEVLPELAQHVDDTEQGAGREAVGGGQVGEGVEGAEQVRRTVDQQ